MKKIFKIVGIIIGAAITVPILLYVLLFYLNCTGIKEEDFVIAGVGLNSTRSEVIKKLGKPLGGIPEPNKDESWNYPGLELFSVGDKREWGSVFGITVTSDKYTTYRGIKIGDSVGKVLLRYKNLHCNQTNPIMFKNGVTKFDALKEEIYFERPLKLFDALREQLFFEISNGKVVKIEIWLATD